MDGALYISTGPDERKAKNLAENSHCVVTTGSNTLFGDLDVVVEGDVVNVSDEGRLQRIADTFASKYGTDTWHFTVCDGAFRDYGGAGRALVLEVAPTKAFGFGRAGRSAKPAGASSERGYKGGLIMTAKSDEERPPKPDSEVRPAGSGERIVRANGVDLCVETFGDPADPPILLIMGGASSMDWWEDGFCERLMAGSRFIIRYDHRDTGRSISYEPGAAPYSLRDLADDAVGLLDALGLESAHLVGMSVGGWIGQLVALENPDRVASLTLISTTPTAGPSDPDLPEMSQELQAFFTQEASEPDWSDRAAVIDYIVEGERPFAGSRPFDEAAIRAIAARVFDRTTNLASSITNHAGIDSGDRWRERLGEVSVPTLVIHGTEDPMYPYGNAVALAKEIPGAQLLALERVGHEVPPRALWDVVVPAILRHTVSAP